MRIIMSMLFVAMSASVIFAQEAETAATAASNYNEGLTALKAKEYEKALASFDKALEMADPEADEKVINLAKKNTAIAAYFQGNALLKAKDYEGAMTLYKKGMESNEAYYNNQYGVAKVLDRQGSTKEAVEAYVKAGNMAIEAGKEERGNQYIAKGASCIGKAYAKKNYDKVIEAGEMYVTDHQDASANYYVAKAYMNKKNGAKALTFAQKAAELGGDTDEGKYIYCKAEALEMSGKKAEAAAAYKKVPAGKYYDQAQYKAGQL